MWDIKVSFLDKRVRGSVLLAWPSRWKVLKAEREALQEEGALQT